MRALTLGACALILATGCEVVASADADGGPDAAPNDDAAPTGGTQPTADSGPATDATVGPTADADPGPNPGDDAGPAACTCTPSTRPASGRAWSSPSRRCTGTRP